ncbi:MAG: hypothetical protein WCM93_08300 [Bacteroidota bacterium]
MLLNYQYSIEALYTSIGMPANKSLISCLFCMRLITSANSGATDITFIFEDFFTLSLVKLSVDITRSISLFSIASTPFSLSGI